MGCEKIFQKNPLTSPIKAHTVWVSSEEEFDLRPSFMPIDVYEGDFTRGQMDKLFRVSDMKVTSFIQKCEGLGNPISHRSPARHEGFHFGATRVYRCSEVVDRALLDGYDVLPTRVKELKRSEVELRGDVELLRKELSILREQRDNALRHFRFESIASDLGLSKLYREEEIVGSKLSYEESSGVYFLIKEDRVVYVGQSVNVFSRISSHVNYKDFDSYAYVLCPKDKLDILESLYIHTLNPPLQGKCSSGDGLSAPIGLKRILELGKKDA